MLLPSARKCSTSTFFPRFGSCKVLVSSVHRASAGAPPVRGGPLWKRCPRFPYHACKILSSPRARGGSMPVSDSHASTSASPSCTATDGRVYFGGKTALQIMRMANPRDLAPAIGAARALPDRPPRKRQIEDAIRRAESAYPGLSIERPANASWSAARREAARRPRANSTCARLILRARRFTASAAVPTSAPRLSPLFMRRCGATTRLPFLSLDTNYAGRTKASERELRRAIRWSPSHRFGRCAPMCL